MQVTYLSMRTEQQPIQVGVDFPVLCVSESISWEYGKSVYPLYFLLHSRIKASMGSQFLNSKEQYQTEPDVGTSDLILKRMELDTMLVIELNLFISI